jgi:Icc-related predicted phosphoesterase
MIRVAAVGDVHLGAHDAGVCRAELAQLPEHADVLLLAGDLTRLGSVEEMHVVAGEFCDLGVPVVAVLGNHDHQSDQADDGRRVLEDAGIRVLEGEGVVLEVGDQRLGVAGVKGFGGGFAGKCGAAFGEPEMKAFIRHTEEVSEALADALAALEADVRIALTHYSPVTDTLRGEPPEIYPFLGSYLLAEAIDGAATDLAVHGHAHYGREHGLTPGGVRVRNVARPVIGTSYALYQLTPAS